MQFLSEVHHLAPTTPYKLYKPYKPYKPHPAGSLARCQTTLDLDTSA